MSVAINPIGGIPTPSEKIDFEYPPTQPQPPVQVEMPFENSIFSEETFDPEKQKNDLKEAVEKLNQTAIIFDRALKFQIHDKTKETMVSVIDVNTEKVIREIPPKEVLDIISKMKDYLGLIFDKKA